MPILPNEKSLLLLPLPLRLPILFSVMMKKAQDSSSIGHGISFLKKRSTEHEKRDVMRGGLLFLYKFQKKSRYAANFDEGTMIWSYNGPRLELLLLLIFNRVRQPDNFSYDGKKRSSS